VASVHHPRRQQANGHGLDLVEDRDGQPLTKPSPHVRAGWSRALARAEGSARSGLSRFGWDTAIDTANEMFDERNGLTVTCAHATVIRMSCSSASA